MDAFDRLELQFNSQSMDAFDRLESSDSIDVFDKLDTKTNIFSNPVDITQEYGNSNPDIEVFSGGVNTGTDFGTQVGTPINLPSGNWEVVDAFSQASGSGYIGNSENSGYGNSIVVKNRDTGETLRFSHLSQVDVVPGQILRGGQIGSTGATGNVTGPHLDLEYTNSQGQLGDVLQSPYGQYIPRRTN